MKNVAIICGGDSGEFEISVKSAQVVKQNLDPEKYNSKIIVVSKKGWYGLLKDGTRVDVDKHDFSISVGGHRTKFDVAFNAVHGEPGENGPLSGYLELMGIPCTSSPLTTCALTFHKDCCKRVVASYGVKVAPSILINDSSFTVMALSCIVLIWIFIYQLYQFMHLVRLQFPSFRFYHRYLFPDILMYFNTVKYKASIAVVCSEDETRQSTQFPWPF